MSHHRTKHVPVRAVFSGRLERAFDDTCVWHGCQAEISPAGSPLCTRHLTKAYRIYRTSHLWMLDETPAEQSEQKRPDTGFVYFIRFRDRVKIGWTTNLRQRLADLPHEEVLGAVPGTMKDERRCHVAFAHLRVTGEWFRLEPELLAFIKDVASQHSDAA